MTKLLKTFSFSLLLVLLLGTFSCMKDDVENRTLEQEQKELNEWLLSLIQEGYDVDTTALGVYYMVHKSGSGAYVMSYDTIAISYEGYLLDGTRFDASADWNQDGVWEFVYSEVDLVPGFNEALSYLNKDAEVEFIIPSWLAYGAYGSPPAIGSFETLIFAVKLVDHKPLL